jgi:hypothetical protein
MEMESDPPEAAGAFAEEPFDPGVARTGLAVVFNVITS